MYHYFPTYKSVPFFHKKNELQLNAAYGGVQTLATFQPYDWDKLPYCFDFQMNYSLTNHLYVDFQSVYDVHKIPNFDVINQISYSYLGLDFGYYKWYGHFLAGLKSGLKSGKVELKYYDNTKLLNHEFFYADNQIYSICPFLGYETEYSQIAIQINCLKSNYYNIDNKLTQIPTYYYDYNYFTLFKQISKPFDEYFIEPAITLKGGSKNAKVVFQAIRSFNFGNTRLNFMKFNLFVGLEFKFDIDIIVNKFKTNINKN
jgi:hypothetical protein